MPGPQDISKYKYPLWYIITKRGEGGGVDQVKIRDNYPFCTA